MNILPISTSYNNKNNNNTQSFKALKVPNSSLDAVNGILSYNGFKKIIQESLNTSSPHPENDMMTRVFASLIRTGLKREKEYGVLSSSGPFSFIIPWSRDSEAKAQTILLSGNIKSERIQGL